MIWVGIAYSTDAPDEVIDDRIRRSIEYYNGEEVESGYFSPLSRRLIDVEFSKVEDAKGFAAEMRDVFKESLQEEEGPSAIGFFVWGPENPLLGACTGCGDEPFVCILGNGDPNDAFDGPYALCEEAYREWLVVGHEITLTHD